MCEDHQFCWVLKLDNPHQSIFKVGVDIKKKNQDEKGQVSTVNSF